jgi:hypothetical protein
MGSWCGEVENKAVERQSDGCGWALVEHTKHISFLLQTALAVPAALPFTFACVDALEKWRDHFTNKSLLDEIYAKCLPKLIVHLSTQTVDSDRDVSMKS